MEKDQIKTTPSPSAPRKAISPYSLLYINTTIALLVWVTIIIVSLSWNLFSEQQHMRKMVQNEARVHFSKDQSFRLWAASHGGVYVEIDENTPPNPYLSHLANRDVETATGQRLTLMNPAYMIRQMMDQYFELYKVKGRITSLNPLNPINNPDPWEENALQSFENGAKEVFDFADINGEPHIRLMRPMVTDNGCLKCHQQQGYWAGDIRGGVGVSVPIAPYLKLGQELRQKMILSHLVVGLAGLVLIFIVVTLTKGQILANMAAKKELLEAYEAIEGKVKERTVELADLNKNLEDEIRHHKQTEDNLQRSERMLRSVLNTIPVRVFWKDLDSNYLGCNHYFAMDAGLDSPDQIIGKNDSQLPWSNLTEQRLIDDRNVLESGQVKLNYEEHIRLADGSMAWVNSSKAPLMENDGNIYALLGCYDDITLRKKMEEELHRSQKLESIGTLAGGIAHDFNNLHTAVFGFISMARKYIDYDSKADQLLAESEKASMLARKLTQRLITFSKGGAPIRTPLSIAKLIADSSSLALSGSNISCEYSIASDLLEIDADESQILQVISNLTANARESMPEGGKIYVRAQNISVQPGEPAPVFSMPAGDYVKIDIEDQGVGISSEDLPKIFDPYYSSKKMGNQKGIGLGLSTVYSIITKHDGFITVDSTEGDGSVFYIYLPASRMRPREHKIDTVITERKGRILVLDDEKFIRNIVGETVRFYGWDGEFAEEGQEAVSLYKSAMKSGSPFDLVLLDLTIPGGIGGKETLELLRGIDPDVKGIVSSGYSADPVMVHFKDYGFIGAITKPFTPDNLGRLLDKNFKEMQKNKN